MRLFVVLPFIVHIVRFIPLQLLFPPPEDLPKMPSIDDSFLKTTLGMVLLNFSALLVAYLSGRFDFSVLWIIVASLAYYFSVRRNEAHETRTLIYQSVKADERATIMAKVNELPSWVFFPDMERCEWLNRIINQLWPHIGKYAEKYIIDLIEPAMQKSLPLSFKFVKIDMGDDAPRLGGIKVYKEHIARGELVMDMEIFYAGDAEIKFKTGKFVAGVKEIQCHGFLRVICRPLIDDMPFVGGVTAFFLQTPAIDFNLTNFADAFDLPGVGDIIRKVVNDQINRMFVLPNKFSLALVPDVSQYELKFTEPDGVLRLHLPSARELVKSDIGLLGKGKSDPYCIIRVGSQEFKTKTINNTTDPKWNEWFEAVVDQLAGQQLEIEVFDEDPGSADDFLGRCSIDIIAIAKSAGSMLDQWTTLEDTKQGQLHIRAFWLDVSGEHPNTTPNLIEIAIRDALALSSNTTQPLGTALLMLYFDSAQALPLIRKSPTEPCPYLHATCGHESFKTFTCQRTCNPVWEEQRIFIIHDPRTQHVKLEILDEKSGQHLGALDFNVASLLDKSDMQMNAPFQLQKSGMDSNLKMRAKLRMLKSGGEIDAVNGQTPMKNGNLHAAVRPTVSQSAMKHSTPLPVPSSQIYSRSANTTPAYTTTTTTTEKQSTVSVVVRSPTPGSATSNDSSVASGEQAAVAADERESIMSSSNSTAIVHGNGGERPVSPLSTRSTTSSSFAAGDNGQELRHRGSTLSGDPARMRLTILHNKNKQVLQVTIHECGNLQKLFKNRHEAEHFHEPYVSVHLKPTNEKRKTSEHRKTDKLNPHFESTLEFPCEHEARLRGCWLELKVKFKHGLFSSKTETIGAVKISLDPIAETGPAGLRDWYQIDPDSSSEDDESRK